MSKDIIYFDNAATTWPKPEQVYQKMDSVMRNFSGNPGRGGHSSATLGSTLINTARKEIATFFNVPSPDYVIFSQNGTDSLNIAIKGLIKPGNKVLVTPFEHNSVMRPLNSLQEMGVIVETAKVKSDFSIDLDSVQEICKNGIDYAVISHISNVTGIVTDVSKIAEIVHSYGGLLIVDASQSSGIIEIDMQVLGIDILASAGHKGLMGPMGSGILLLANDFPIKPFREGGTGILSDEDFQPNKLPHRLEAGTNNLPAIAGLLEGIRFINSVGINKISEHESKLASQLINGLKQIKGITLYGNLESPQSGVVSFTSDKFEPSVIENILDQVYKIQVRSGLHCSPNGHKTLGTFPVGTVRVSLGFYNTKEEVDVFVEAMKGMI